jgi:DNA-binding response OmpR family regulator
MFMHIVNTIGRTIDAETVCAILNNLISDRIISKEELLKEIFGYKEGVETHTVETHIYKLRQKINDDENGLIYTKEGGYTINLK